MLFPGGPGPGGPGPDGPGPGGPGGPGPGGPGGPGPCGPGPWSWSLGVCAARGERRPELDHPGEDPGLQRTAPPQQDRER